MTTRVAAYAETRRQPVKFFCQRKVNHAGLSRLVFRL